jgi:hypothetical protein
MVHMHGMRYSRGDGDPNWPSWGASGGPLNWLPTCWHTLMSTRHERMHIRFFTLVCNKYGLQAFRE